MHAFRNLPALSVFSNLLPALAAAFALAACNTQDAVSVMDPGAEPSPVSARTAGIAQDILNSGFEDQSTSCWSSRNSSGSNSVGCGRWTGIGAWPAALVENSVRRSGTKSLRLTYSRNEEAGAAHIAVSADTVNVRTWFYFDNNFDFGQGVKIGRVSSFNRVTQVNDIDIILQVRSAGAQCGTTNMADIGVYFNGKPTGYDWGAASAVMSFQRGRWYAVEYQVILNTPGSSNGIVRLWVDGVLKKERTGLRPRGGLSSTVKLNTVKIGGWYSNSANGNSCPNPAQASRLFMDDVIISKGFIGLR